MATIRVKRRASGGAVGAPATLQSSEPAYNEADDTLYLGYGDNGSGVATSIRAIGGAGTFATKAYVTSQMAGAGAGDMLKSVYDTNNDGKVNAAAAADTVPFSGVTGKPTDLSGYGITDATPSSHIGSGGATHAVASTSVAGFMSATDKTKLDGVASGANNYTHPSGDGNRHVPATGTTNSGKFLKSGATAASEAWTAIATSDVTGLDTALTGKADASHTHTTSQVTGLDTALAAKAPLASPTFTGTPLVPTAAAGTNTTQAASTAFVSTAVANLVASAPGLLDTLDELAAALGDDPNFATTITTALSAKAPLASPALTGTPTAPTAAAATSTTQVATTAMVQAAIAAAVIDGGTF